MTLAIVVGTRPELIKMAPVVNHCIEQGINHHLIHSGQHYSYEMDQIFFEDLGLPKPNYQLEISKGSDPGKQTAELIEKLEKIFIKEKYETVLVQGDTNTVLAGGIGAVKQNLKVGHVEAGLRSFDRSMPEEINRILTDHCSNYLFAPTEVSKQNLENENIVENIFVTGNTIVDSLQMYMEKAEQDSDVLDEYDLEKKNFCLLTVHRQENVDHKQKLENIIEGIKNIGKDNRIIYPIHPRTRKNLKQFKLLKKFESIDGLELIDPIGYFDFLVLENNAKIALTDSGGVQEETCILQTPCITLRENTERPETLTVGANRLVGTDPKQIETGFGAMVGKKGWDNPFGEGKTAEKILNNLSN